MMSGLSLLDRAVVSFSTMPVHCCRSNVTLTSGCVLLNSPIANLTKSSGVSPPFNHSRSSPPSPVPPTIGAGVVSATVVGVAAASVAAGAAVVAAGAGALVALLLLLSSPHAAIAMVNAANPAATLMILICFPLVVTGCSPDLLSLRAEALVVSDDAELVAENERGRAQEHSVVAQRAE